MSATNANVLVALCAARKRLARFGAWTQNAAARDGNGNTVPARDAVCWCTAGAMMGAVEGCVGEYEALCALGRELSGREMRDDEAMCLLAEWNDEPTRTHADVLALYDRTIAAVGAGHHG